MKTKKNIFGFPIDTNAIKDNGNGVISFGAKGLTITDNSEQRNGTKYDIKSMDISEYKGQLTADHSRSVREIIGAVQGTRKVANKRVVIDAIKFAIEESALALFVYNMMKAGYISDFSIETFGPWPDPEDDTYYDSKLIGLSVVTVGNNRSASVKNEVQEIAKNSIEEAKDKDLDPSIVENNYLCYDNETDKSSQKNTKINKESMKFKTIKNSRKFAVTVKFENAAGDEVEKTLEAGETLDIKENQVEAVEKQINEAEDPSNSSDLAKTIREAVNSAVKPLQEKMESLEQQVFDNDANEPEFKKSKNKANISNKASEFADMDYRLRHGEQIVAAKQWLKGGNEKARKRLEAINEFHKEKLVEKGLVDNSIDTVDFGNFVISPELISEIEGHRSNYKDLLSKVSFKETLSTKFGWLKRSGDIDMTSVKFLTDANNGNLKPLSTYGADYNEKDMEELAAVTPVMNATNRFLAADIIGDIAEGYRNDYDRKRAQLVIARLQQATDSSGKQQTYNTTSAITSLQSWVEVWSSIMEEVPNGVFIMSYKTKGELVKQAIAAGIDPVAAMAMNAGKLEPILGAPTILVPNDLLPALNGSGSDLLKTFVVDDQNVTINQSVFYADLSKFKGRVSGGLTYDLSTEAAYEENGTVKSAFQRNELVLRGSFFRNGAFVDEDFASSLHAGAVS